MFKRILDGVSVTPSLAPEVVLALVSERLLVMDAAESTAYRFRHARFIEYLLAWYMARTTYESGSTAFLDKFTETVYSSGIVSMYHVHDLASPAYLLERFLGRSSEDHKLLRFLPTLHGG